MIQTNDEYYTPERIVVMYNQGYTIKGIADYVKSERKIKKPEAHAYVESAIYAHLMKLRKS